MQYCGNGVVSDDLVHLPSVTTYRLPQKHNQAIQVVKYWVRQTHKSDVFCKQTLENAEWVIKKRKSRETGSIGYTRQKKIQHNMCWTQLCADKHK